MNKLYKLNNIAISQLSTVNLKMLKEISEKKKITEVLFFNKDAYIELQDSYMIKDIEEINKLLIDNINDDYKCAKIIDDNLVNINEEVYLDYRFWTYTAIDVFHKYTYEKIIEEKMTVNNYSQHIICKTMNNQTLFNHYIARLWFVTNFSKQYSNKSDIMKFLFNNPHIIDEVFTSDLYFHRIFIYNFINILYNEYNQEGIKTAELRKMKDIFLMYSNNKILDKLTEEEIILLSK